MVTLQILVLPFLVRVRVAQRRTIRFPMVRVSGFFFLWHNAKRLGAQCQTIYNTMPNASEQDVERFMTRCRTSRSKMPNSSEQDAGRENTKREGANHLSPSVSLPQKVGMTRLELATSRPPDVCATNCATSRSLCLRVQRYDFFLLLPNFFVTLFAEKRKMNL